MRQLWYNWRMECMLNFQEKTKEELIETLINLQQSWSQERDQLLELIRLYRHRQFGRKAEAFPEGQLHLFDEAALPKDPKAIETADEEIHIKAYNRKKKAPGRKPLPAHLPREQRVSALR